MPVATLTFGDLTIEGASCAGEETWFRVRPPGLAFDAGRGSVHMSGVADLFLSHGHLDHALGIPYLLSQRRMQGGVTTIHAPTAAIDLIDRFIRAVEGLEGNRYHYELDPMEPGDRVSLGRDLAVEAFATDHLVPSLGFHLLRCKGRLKQELQGRSQQELIELKAAGRPIEDRLEELWLSYSGDTGPGVFELEPRLFESTVLLIECTFLDADSLTNARRYKHIHLEDLVERQTRFRNVELVLHHLSRRYNQREAGELVRRRFDPSPTRVHLFDC